MSSPKQNVRILPIRFVLSGACAPHQGKHLRFDIPFSNNINVRDLKTRWVQPHWPVETLGPIPANTLMIIIKSGVVLTDDVPLRVAVNEKDQQRYLVDSSVQTKDGLITDDSQQIGDLDDRCLLLHLMFRKDFGDGGAASNNASGSGDTAGVAPKRTASQLQRRGQPPAGGGGAGGGGQRNAAPRQAQARSGGCCTAM